MDWKKIASVLIGLVIFAFLLANANLEKTFWIIAGLDIKWLFTAIVLNAVLITVKSVKWKSIVELKGKIPLADAVKYFLIGFFFSSITPGRIGDLVRAKYVREKTGLAFATISVVLDRLIDIVLLLLIGLVALSVAAEFYGFIAFSPALVLVAFFAVLMGAYIISMKSTAHMIFNPLNEKIVPRQYRKKLSEYFNSIYDAVDVFKKNKIRLIKAIVLGLTAWAIAIIEVYAISESIGTNVPFYAFFMIVPLLALSDIIPLSIGGLGPREFIAINALALFSVQYDMALAFSLVYFFIGYMLVAFIGSFVYIMRKAGAQKQ